MALFVRLSSDRLVNVAHIQEIRHYETRSVDDEPTDEVHVEIAGYESCEVIKGAKATVLWAALQRWARQDDEREVIG